MTKLNENCIRPFISFTQFEKMPIWASDKPLPSKGDVVHVTNLNIGRCIVESLFVENGYIGMVLDPQDPSEAYLKQVEELPEDMKDHPLCIFPGETKELRSSPVCIEQAVEMGLM